MDWCPVTTWFKSFSSAAGAATIAQHPRATVLNELSLARFMKHGYTLLLISWPVETLDIIIGCVTIAVSSKRQSHGTSKDSRNYRLRVLSRRDGSRLEAPRGLLATSVDKEYRLLMLASP